MKVAVLCEYSGRVRDAFISRGHDAISCDLLPTDAPGPHYKGDAFDLLDQQWDLIIAHPPCTALTVAGNSTYGEGQPKYQDRLEAVKWTVEFWEACKSVSPRVCFENPVGVLPRLGGMPKPHYVQPYQFGHMEQKKTGHFLHGLPPLNPTNNVYEEMMKLPKNQRERLHYLPPSPDRWKIRSTTFQGIADAMAEQWGVGMTEAPERIWIDPTTVDKYVDGFSAHSSPAMRIKGDTLFPEYVRADKYEELKKELENRNI